MSMLGSLDGQTAARVTGGRWIGNQPGPLGAFSFDSRNLEAGEVFVAVRARRDGHDYLGSSAVAGAQAALVSRAVRDGLPQLLVDDTVVALGRLAHERRMKFAGQVVAITGSNGKTTVRAMLEGILRTWAGDQAVLASKDSWNNHLGLPATLLRLVSGIKHVVLEAGMNNPGELTALGKIALPDICVLTNAGRAHGGNFSGPEEIARAKGELLKQTRASGVCVLNRDDPNYAMWKAMAGPRRIVSFSVAHDKGADFSKAPQSKFAIVGDGVQIRVALRVPGRHNEANALAAAAAARLLGADAGAIAAGLENFTGARGRLSVGKLSGGGTIIDDTYNANPESVLCAIEVLAQRPEKHKTLVLGDMLELGGETGPLYAEMSSQARQKGIGTVFTFGEMSAGSGDRHFATKAELAEAVREHAGRNCVVLVKGSRAMRMEEIVKSAGGER